MKVILVRDVETLGHRFDIINVKPGFGRNYLIPQSLAVLANKKNMNTLEQRLKQIEKKSDRERAEIEKLIAKLEAASITVGAKVGSTEKIFGSVTNIQLADAIKKQTGIEVDRRKIDIAEDIKTLGTYTAVINLHKDMPHELEFTVVKE